MDNCLNVQLVDTSGNETGGFRSQILDDARDNTILKSDYFTVFDKGLK